MKAGLTRQAAYCAGKCSLTQYFRHTCNFVLALVSAAQFSTVADIERNAQNQLLRIKLDWLTVFQSLTLVSDRVCPARASRKIAKHNAFRPAAMFVRSLEPQRAPLRTAL